MSQSEHVKPSRLQQTMIALAVFLIVRLLYVDPSRHFGLGLISLSATSTSAKFDAVVKKMFAEGTDVESIVTFFSEKSFDCSSLRNGRRTCAYRYWGLIPIAGAIWIVSIEERNGKLVRIRGSCGAASI